MTRSFPGQSARLAIVVSLGLCAAGAAWAQAYPAKPVRLIVPFAALLTIVGILLAAVTDNGFVYAYVMGPAGLLMGAALGLPPEGMSAAASVSTRAPQPMAA